jgi:hypothetical protein
MKQMSVWVGFDPREAAAFAVAKQSIKRNSSIPIPTYGLVLSDLQERGLYYRETRVADGRLFDVISDHPMATEFAISRFLTVYLAREHQYRKGDRWALFMDSDVMCRRSIDALFSQADPDKAVQVVKHNFNPTSDTKMDGQVQSRYARKNWSSVMLFNVDHSANDALTPELVNSVPGRDLHAFCWLEDHLIGDLSPDWNYLVGFHQAAAYPNPGIVHFTDGIPTMPGYEDCEYAQEWRRVLKQWAR